MGGSRDDEFSSLNPVTRLQQHRIRTVTDAFNDMPAMKEARAHQERLDRAVVAGRFTAGISYAEARLVYGNPLRVERDGICRRLIWRNTDHAARVCISRVTSVLEWSAYLDVRWLLPSFCKTMRITPAIPASAIVWRWQASSFSPLIQTV